MTSLMWFEKREFVSRLARIQTVLAERGLDALLAFQPETITWATGHFTRAYTGYQVALIPREGEPVLICRNVSRYYAENTVAVGSIEYWRDGQDRDALTLSVIRKHLGSPKSLGIELNSWVLNPLRFEGLVKSLDPARLVDVGKDMASLRLIKSRAEIEYQRRAARAAEAAMEAALTAARPGANELDVAAAAASALILAGSDTPGPGVLSSGERARHLHGGYMSRRLEEGDTLQYEPTPHVRHYNARFMRTIKVGRASKTEIENAEKLIAVQDKAIAAVAPGVPASVPDRIYREGILATGLTDHYTNKTFYSIGLMMPPVGGEPLEAAPGCTWTFEPGMTFHTYVLADSFGFSETISITKDGYERLTNFPRELIVT